MNLGRMMDPVTKRPTDDRPTMFARSAAPFPSMSPAKQHRRPWVALLMLAICLGLSLVWMVHRWTSKHRASTAPLTQTSVQPAPVASPQRSRVVENPTPAPDVPVEPKPSNPATTQSETGATLKRPVRLNTNKNPHAPTKPSQSPQPTAARETNATPSQAAPLPPASQPPVPAEPVYGPYERKAHLQAHPGDTWQRRAEKK